jgi:predicted amidohydrolase YtcJ
VANQAKLYAPPAGPGKDVDSIIAELKKFAADRKIPKGEMIMAYGYDDTVMPNGRLLNRDDLDKAFPDNPVRVDHVSMHGAVMNSLALKQFGFDAKTKTPAGGIIVRKPGTNEPWGLIMETAFLPVFEKTPPLTPQQEVEGTKAAQRMYAEAGITTAQEGATHLAQLQTIKRATDAGANVIDVVAFPFVTDADKILAEFPIDGWGKYNQRFKIGGIKISIDGSPQGRTAAFTTPYLTGGPGGEKNWKGELFVPQEVINQGLKKVYGLGVPVLFHVNGDAAVDAMIKAHEFAAAEDPTKDRNVTAIHAQFTRKDHIPIYVKYKIRPSFYTLHTYYFAEAHIKNRGKAQAMYISPMRDAIDAGLHPTNHTDAVVAPLDQMFMLWTAVNRVSRGGAEIGPDQRVTPLEGLKSMTIWAAEQYGEQATKGSLEPGKLADLVILDRNPLKVDKMAIKDIKVVETLKEGKSIYRAP